MEIETTNNFFIGSLCGGTSMSVMSMPWRFGTKLSATRLIGELSVSMVASKGNKDFLGMFYSRNSIFNLRIIQENPQLKTSQFQINKN